jgi:very-short-patch-repair endonuclease
MKWPTDKNQHEYMKSRQKQNEDSSKWNKNELWMYEKLKTTPYKWKRQSMWGYRIFDFWCSYLGVAIEIDGKEHKKIYDSIRDKYNFETSGILVLRVKNRDELGAMKALDIIAHLPGNWNDRRRARGLKEIKSIGTLKQQKRI